MLLVSFFVTVGEEMGGEMAEAVIPKWLERLLPKKRCNVSVVTITDTETRVVGEYPIAGTEWKNKACQKAKEGKSVLVYKYSGTVHARMDKNNIPGAPVYRRDGSSID